MKWIIILLSCLTTFGKMKVVTTTTDIAWLVKKIGGGKVSVKSLLDGTEDPHYVDAMPHWISKSSNADIFCKVGLELEVAWAPKILQRSGNAKIQKGGSGYCDLGKSITALEKPKGAIDRSMGDVHAGGNPHYHLGPSAFLEASVGVLNKLIENDSKNAEYYLKNQENFVKEINALKAEVKTILKDSKNKKFMSYHKEFSYFIKDFGLLYAGEIEEKPGVPPSAGRIARVSIEAKRNKIYKVIATKTNPKKILDKFNEISKVQYIRIPISISKSHKIDNYRDLIINIAKSMR